MKTTALVLAICLVLTGFCGNVALAAELKDAPAEQGFVQKGEDIWLPAGKKLIGVTHSERGHPKFLIRSMRASEEPETYELTEFGYGIGLGPLKPRRAEETIKIHERR